MNTLTGYSKNKLSDNYLLTAAGGHLAAGVENGSAAIYVSWPTYAKLKELNYIDANYGTGDYGHPDEEFLKGICKWAIANYSGSSCTLLGAIAPNSSGTCCMHLYGNSGFDATTKLPRYCMGWYQTLGGNLAYFGTSDYVWKYSRYASVADVKNPVNYYWANVPISDKSSTTTSPTVNTITANNYITFGTYGARFTSDIRDSWRTSIYGDTTNQSRLRTVRTDVTIADFSEHYGSGLAWASGDTQGYLSVSHASGKAWIGGGNSNKLNWSTELITGKNIANQSVKQATTATKWATARTITLNGLLQGSVSLDGSLNVTLTSYNYHCIAGSSATNNYPYHLIMKCDPITGLWVDLFGLYRITQGHKGGNIGVFYVVVKTNSGTTASTCEIGWIYRKGFAVDAIQAGFYDVLGNTYIDVFCKTNSTYIKNTVEQISITKNRGEIGRGFTLQSSSESFTLLSDKSYITNTSKTTSYSTIASGLTNAAGGNALRTYTSIISATDSQAHIYLATIASKLGSSTLGGTYQPIYLSSGTATACTSYAKAIKSITRSGTTFTYTRLDGTTGTFTQLDNNTTYSFTSGVDKFTVTPSSGSAINVNVGTLLVNGTYTGGGGQQRPSYIGSGKVRWNMMRATTDYFDSSPFSGYCDWMMMDTYTGPDVPYVTMIGVLKSATPHAYIASGAKGDSSGKWTIKTLLDSDNYTTYTVKKDGTGASGTWGITASKATNDVDGNAFKTTYLRKVTVANNANNDFNTFENMTLTGRGDPKTGASLSNAPWTGSGPGGGYGVLTYLWSGYGVQMAFGYNSNKIYIRNKNYSSGSTAWSSTWDSLALTSDLKNPTDYYWADVKISSYSSTSTTPTFGLVRIISDNYPGLLVKRSNSTNSSIIGFANSNGVLGGIGTSWSANSGLRRYKHDYSESYLILDANNSSVSGGGSSWGSSITVNLGGTTKTLTIPSAPTSVSGNAGTATTLQTARTISLSTGVVATPISFNGSANISIPVTEIKEGYLTWGGKNHAGEYGPVDTGIVPTLGANRFAFMPADGVTIEVSTNGGSTWSTYPSIVDLMKIDLFNGNGTTLYLGGSSAKYVDKTNYKLRITIDTDTAKVYTALKKLYIYLSTNGSTGSYCTVTSRTQADFDAGNNTWVTHAENVTVSGWSGWNVINVDFTTYGNNTSLHRLIRMTFGCTSHSSSLNNIGLTIFRIIGVGGVGWETPSTLALTGNIFTYDYLQNVSFPGNILPEKNNTKTLGSTSYKWSNVYATTFTGNLTGNVTGNLIGNVTGNVTGSSGSCTGNAATATKLGTATKGSTSKPIYLNAGTPTECSTYAGGTAVTLNGTSKSGSTASFYAPTSAGTSGQVLVSTGGTPTWLAISTGGGYIGRTPVLANAAALSLTGIGNITPETADSYKLGTSDKQWYLVFSKYFTSGKVTLRSNYDANTAVNTGYLEYTSTNGYFYITANSIAAGTSGGFVMKTTKNGVVSQVLLESNSDYGKVKISGDLCIGGRVSNPTALITSDDANNIYMSVNNRVLLACVSKDLTNLKGVVRPTLSLKGLVSLGERSYPWKDLHVNDAIRIKGDGDYYYNITAPTVDLSSDINLKLPSHGGTLITSSDLVVRIKKWGIYTFSYNHTDPPVDTSEGNAYYNISLVGSSGVSIFRMDRNIPREAYYLELWTYQGIFIHINDGVDKNKLMIFGSNPSINDGTYIPDYNAGNATIGLPSFNPSHVVVCESSIGLLNGTTAYGYAIKCTDLLGNYKPVGSGRIYAIEFY